MLLVQLSDLHICRPGTTVNGMVQTDTLAEKAFAAVSSMRPPPDAMILSGDLTESGLDPEYDVLVRLLRRYQCCPVYAIPGNHDRRENFIHKLSHLPGIGEHPEFVQYVIETSIIRLVMLDTVVPGAGHGRLSEKQLAWIDRTLAAETSKPTIIVMHHPPFDCGIAPMDRIKLENAADFAAIVERHRQVRRILCGHVHRAINSRVGNANASIAPSTAHQVALALDSNEPLAFVLEPGAFEIHRVSAHGDTVSHVAYIEKYPGPFPFILSPDYPGHVAQG